MSMQHDVVDALQMYVKEKIATGGFLRSVLENNLKEAFERADVNNRYCMFEIVQYMCNNIPTECWGSPEKVIAWLKKE